MKALDAAAVSSLVGGAPPAASLPPGRGVAFHSADVRPGDVFFALPGSHGHGIAYVDEALARGAAYVVSDLPHPRGIRVPDAEGALLTLGRGARAELGARVVGVTGSAGKTTTKAMLAAALDARSTAGNLNTQRALAATLVDAALAGDGRPLVLELGIDHVGEMTRLVALTAPTDALLTSIAPSHLDGLRSLDTVAREKATLLTSVGGVRLASLQAYRALPLELRRGVTAYAVLDEDEPPPSLPGLVPARRMSFDELGTELSYRGLRLRLPLAGKAMVANALAAIAMAEMLGVDVELAAQRVAGARLEPGRLQRRRVGPVIVLDDSYNSNPASAALALEVLRISPPPHTAVLGDMLELGDESRRHHLELGAATSDLDAVLAVGPASRAVLEANPAALHAAAVEDALPMLRTLPRRGTVLFKASRGMRLERLVRAFEELVAAGADAGGTP